MWLVGRPRKKGPLPWCCVELTLLGCFAVLLGFGRGKILFGCHVFDRLAITEGFVDCLFVSKRFSNDCRCWLVTLLLVDWRRPFWLYVFWSVPFEGCLDCRRIVKVALLPVDWPCGNPWPVDLRFAPLDNPLRPDAGTGLFGSNDWNISCCFLPRIDENLKVRGNALMRI